ncbi:hypothetical protein PIB30_105228, partial [Stylosanthes scabra]|nr:hypothetical protein [Stylosanthes scabra]
SKEMRSRMTQSIDDSCSNGFTDQGHETKPFDDTCCKKKMDVVGTSSGWMKCRKSVRDLDQHSM